MSFLSLYRKYRPENFNDLIGQDQVKQTLKNALKNNDINFKATTNEKMGFVGRKEGMAAYAVVSVVEQKLWRFFKNLKGEGSIK
mgnify:CR=1 FL=1